MKNFMLGVTLLMLAGCGGGGSGQDGGQSATAKTKPQAVDRPSYRVAWSHYTGWEPWGYAEHAGILKRWADKYGIDIELTLVNDYIESINLYTAGKFDACVMTNMDALTIPVVGGIDSQVIIVGDYSNGNDGIIAKNAKSIKDLKGRTINLVELSVSHYLLARALDTNGMSERDVKLVNTSDADIAALFISDSKGAAVTWNPPLMEARGAKGARLLYDSSKIPGEILDVMVVRTAAPDKLKKALTGAWYETMAAMTGSDATAAVSWMAEAAGASVDEFMAQLGTTAMYYKATGAAAFTRSGAVRETMQQVRQFSFEKGLFGEGAASADIVGIEFDDGSVLGDKANIRMRFTAKYMQMAADGKL